MMKTLPAALAPFVLLLGLGAAPTVRAGADTDSLLAAVPASASALLVVDHARLGAHPHYQGLLGFIRSQGWGKSLLATAGSGLVPGQDVLASVSFRTAGVADASVLAGKLEPAKVRAWAQQTLGAAFATGTEAGREWFQLTKDLVAADLGGGRMVVGPSKMALAALAVGDGRGKAIAKRGGFKALRTEATKGDPPLWAVTWVPKKTREALIKRGATDMAAVERATLSIRGTAALDLAVTGHATDAEGAKRFTDGLNGKIERKVLKNGILRALGVAALAERLTVKAEGDRIVGAMNLTEAQVGLLARYGGKILAALK